jgi:toxin FitB
MIILDTDVLSAVMVAEPAIVAWLNRQPKLSVWTTTVTVLEIRSGLLAMAAGRRRTDRELAFRDIMDIDLQGRVLAFDRTAAEEAALLTAARRTIGRVKETRDTMIAGIALAQRATLATRNIRHFDDLSVPVVNPWHN